MNRYLIVRSVDGAEGSQTFWVDAHDEADAIERHKAGEGGIHSEEINVTDLGAPEVCGETTPDDYGDFADLYQPKENPPHEEAEKQDPVMEIAEAEGRRIHARHKDPLTLEVGTKLYTHPAPMKPDGSEVYLIFFDDQDRKPIILTDKDAALKTYEKISMNWNAHLFAKVDSNSRDAYEHHPVKVEAAPIPEGYVLVPKEPTEKMIQAGMRQFNSSAPQMPLLSLRKAIRMTIIWGWGSMLAAAEEGK